MEIVPSASQDDKKRKPLTLASLRASVLPMVSFPEGLGNPGSSPRRPCSGLTPVCRWTQRCDTGAPADVQPVPERNSFCCLVAKSCPTL